MSAAAWLRQRQHDSLLWPRRLVRDLPVRLGRLARRPTPPQPAAAMMPPRLFRTHALLALLLDLFGALELLQIWLRLGARTSPLTPEEQQAVAAVLGETALRYGDVRIAEGGWLRLAFWLNGRRAFALGHTIFMPEKGRADLSLLVHELVHTGQYERLGSRYIGEALYAQWRLGRGCYDYGGPGGLAARVGVEQPYACFNREAQAQIVMDYVRRKEAGEDVRPYEPFIAALRQGAF
ncbi:MAG: DUF4157 domain-containing protein [Chloroflexi bacterium]|nr:DUF4157 domain-containing protein [Chloroflexota bacterium]